VRRLSACLDGLPALERRVLVLRAGLGPRRPRSRARVARALDLTTRRVARVERRGLRRLRGLARSGCGGRAPASSVPAAGDTASAPGFSRALLVAEAIAPAAAAPAPRDQIQVKGEQQSSGSSAPAPVLAPPAEVKPPVAVMAPERRAGGGTADLTLPLLLVLAAIVAVGLASRGARRSIR
jgi:hypothetical protein